MLWLFPGTLLLGSVICAAGIPFEPPAVRQAGVGVMLGGLLTVALALLAVGFVGSGR